ncbi:uncharacterized protein METZ01_LOCUS51980 [marine metagenome]|uniref:Uncharacterized protein n=1 Tax=marine metagenome TaxID=408172 RepID=A0A381S4X8_9ZZZZ
MMVGPGINLDDLVTSMVAGSTTRLQR